MRRYAIVLGLAAALAGATAAPAAAHTITPANFDFGNVPLNTSPDTQFTVTAVGTDLSGQAEVVSGDKTAFRTSVSTVPPASRCDGSLDAGASCVFVVSFEGAVQAKPGSFTSYSAVVGMEGGPTATVAARTGSSSGKGSKKKCKKKGKKGAASAKKKKCKKKGKK